MQLTSRAVWHGSGMALVLLLLILALLFSLNGSLMVSAQGAEPTATPTDPGWLAFSAARTAVEEERGVDLRTVRNWSFFQDSWELPFPGRADNAAGIDSCAAAVFVTDARRIYFGWTVRITDLRNNVYEARVSFNLDHVTVCDEPSELRPEAATNPEATPDPSLPVPVTGSGATGSFELGGHVDGFSTVAINAMRASGMTWAKKQVRLEWGLPTGLSMIQDAKAAGFRILLGVVGDRNALAANFDGYLATYTQFVAALAAAGADAIEVWNEPNIDREWPAGQINGANYTRMLAAAYNAIKTANPATMVISGAPAPTGFFGAAGCTDAGCNDDVFMQQMAAAGAAQYMDCVGLHYNEGIVSPGTTSGDKRGEYPTYYFGSMLQRGYRPFGGKPVCFTELGYLSPQGMGSALPGGFAWAGDVTVAEHAAWLADAASRSAQSGIVRLMIIWNVNFTRWDSDPMGGYAIIRPDGSCPACTTLGQVMGG